MKKNYIFILFTVLFSGLNAQILSEDFDDVDTLLTRPTNPWKTINFSSPVGDRGWFNSPNTVSTGFAAFNGDTNTSLLRADYGAVDDDGIISALFITPPISLKNGDTVSFYTRCTVNSSGGVTYPDRLIVRINTVDAGADSVTDLGDGITFLDKYDSILVDINPTWSKLPYPIGFPRTWTKITSVINKFTGANARLSRIAFQNYNDSGGFSGAKSNIFGIDALRITASGGGSSSLNTINTFNQISIYPNPTQNYVAVKGFSGNVKASVLASDGRLVKSEVISNNGKIDIENLAPGFYNLKIENGIETIYKKISKR